MVRNLVLQADQLQAELIISEIPHSGRAFLRGLAFLPATAAAAAAATPATAATPAAAAVAGVAGRLDAPASPEAELAEIIEMARRLTESLGGSTLLAGFRPDGPIAGLDPENPPPGMQPYTSFVCLSADPALLARQESPAPVPGARPPAVSASADPGSASLSRPVPAFRRVRLTPGRIGEFLVLHRDGMAGVPNVPTLSEADVRALLDTGQVDLIELAGGTAIGFADFSIDAEGHTAELNEIAILPEWRGQGIGRAVIAELARELEAAGIRSLSLLVATVNRGALRLYESLGFGGSRLFAHWFQMPAGRSSGACPPVRAAGQGV